MFITNAAVYFHNAYFRAKVVLLVLAALNAAVFELTARRTVAQWDTAPSPPPLARAVASLSLVIWIGVIVTGRMIGFTATRPRLRPSRLPWRRTSKICWACRLRVTRRRLGQGS